jgi:hypothetical protein
MEQDCSSQCASGKEVTESDSLGGLSGGFEVEDLELTCQSDLALTEAEFGHLDLSLGFGIDFAA